MYFGPQCGGNYSDIQTKIGAPKRQNLVLSRQLERKKFPAPFGNVRTIFFDKLTVLYGNRDCQASEGFAKHVAEGDADGCCCNQIFSR